jgi:hypothetical protein
MKIAVVLQAGNVCDKLQLTQNMTVTGQNPEVLSDKSWIVKPGFLSAMKNPDNQC